MFLSQIFVFIPIILITNTKHSDHEHVMAEQRVQLSTKTSLEEPPA